jgi:hypothetical protein
MMNFMNVFFATLLGINELTFTISGELLNCSPQQRRWKRSLLQPSLCALSCTVVPGPIAAINPCYK